ncbi:aminoacyl-tRNA hydrolase [Candidatus Uhrbacteria bacterium]|nr:aminoacyl-tRNA hydrolase [Candidatus Uhrbacteria bacterium]MBD3283916.1 aminoacyl-tRNA hydrolase [Candidatus Uhrbacteria bacterium]
MKLIVGLGNIGKQYDGTRHNVGFEVLDHFVEEYDGTWSEESKRHARIALVQVGKERIVCAKPTTYMNRSGAAVQAIASFYKLDSNDLLIVHDEMDLEPGRIQFKQGGQAAGHNGVSDIQRALGTTDLQRLRIGIGHPIPPEMRAEEWVLGPLSPDQAPNALDIVAAMRDWIEEGLESAANRWN